MPRLSKKSSINVTINKKKVNILEGIIILEGLSTIWISSKVWVCILI